MQFILIGLLILVVVLLAGRAFANADPKKLAKNTRWLGGWGLLVLAVILALRGGVFLAVPLAILAFTLLGFAFPWGAPPGNSRKSGGQQSTVRTGLLDMALDHDTGAMEGRVKRGRFEGRLLSSLMPDELEALLEEARLSDPQAAQLLEAFMERMGGPRAGRSSARQGSSTMTIEEAYAILDLKPGVTRDEIHQKHRSLMKKFHPDQGGTDYMAAKLNEAKDILLQHARE